MKLNPTAAEPVRLLTTHEGKFLNFDDLIARLNDDGVIDQILALMYVGHDKGDDSRELMRRAVGNFIVECGREKISGSSYSDETRTDSPGPDSLSA